MLRSVKISNRSPSTIKRLDDLRLRSHHRLAFDAIVCVQPSIAVLRHFRWLAELGRWWLAAAWWQAAVGYLVSCRCEFPWFDCLHHRLILAAAIATKGASVWVGFSFGRLSFGMRGLGNGRHFRHFDLREFWQPTAFRAPALLQLPSTWRRSCFVDVSSAKRDFSSFAASFSAARWAAFSAFSILRYSGASSLFADLLIKLPNQERFAVVSDLAASSLLDAVELVDALVAGTC